MRVLILHDEVAPDAPKDQLDALVQRDAVAAALGRLGHDATSAAFTLNLDANARTVAAHAPDLVFNLVESVGGHGRLIHLAPSLLDVLRIPYTGASAEASFATSNKLLGKTLLGAVGLPTPPRFTIAGCERLADASIPAGTYIIKSVWEHASVGLDEGALVRAERASTLLGTLRERLPLLGGDAFAETFIDGREFNLSLLADGRGGVDVLPPAEIRFVDFAPGKPRIVDYRAKWDEGSFEYVNTPRMFDFDPADAPLLARLHELARACWYAFDLRGHARVDFRVDREGRPWILEVNTNPCLSPDAGFPAAVAHAGLTFDEAIDRIVRDTRAGGGR